jgi:LysM repeat protein
MENLVPAKGYFIYYDKNENMQDYMIDNCISKPKLVKNNTDLKDDNDDKKNKDKKDKDKKDNDKKDNDDNKSNDKLKNDVKVTYDRIDAAKRIRAVLNRKEETRQRLRNGKYAAFAFMSAVICAAFAIMGTSLVQNGDKINTLESELVQMKLSYNKMSEKVENTANQVVETKAVFSQQTPKETKDDTDDKDKNEDEKKPLGEYTLQSGDTLWDICHRFYGSESRLNEILAANNLTDTDIVYVGQKIIIP